MGANPSNTGDSGASHDDLLLKQPSKEVLGALYQYLQASERQRWVPAIQEMGPGRLESEDQWIKRAIREEHFAVVDLSAYGMHSTDVAHEDVDSHPAQPYLYALFVDLRAPMSVLLENVAAMITEAKADYEVPDPRGRGDMKSWTTVKWGMNGKPDVARLELDLKVHLAIKQGMSSAAVYREVILPTTGRERASKLYDQQDVSVRNARAEALLRAVVEGAFPFPADPVGDAFGKDPWDLRASVEAQL